MASEIDILHPANGYTDIYNRPVDIHELVSVGSALQIIRPKSVWFRDMLRIGYEGRLVSAALKHNSDLSGIQLFIFDLLLGESYWPMIDYHSRSLAENYLAQTGLQTVVSNSSLVFQNGLYRVRICDHIEQFVGGVWGYITCRPLN